MARRVILLTGAPEEPEVFEIPDQGHTVLLPEFQSETLSLKLRRSTQADDALPRWTAIQTNIAASSFTPDEQCSAAATVARAQFLECQQIFAQAEQSALSFHDAEADSALTSFVDESINLHEHSQTSEESRQSQSMQHPDVEAHISAMGRLQIANLCDIPNAAYIRHIEPQTMTVNLITGIISTPKFRSVYTTVTKQHLTLVEITVGDETRSGFGINIWLGPNQGQESPLLDATHRLRRGQAVLFRNVALNSFRGKVYGQSIRRNLTRIEFPRSQCSGTKVDAVRTWISHFVAPDDSVPDRFEEAGRAKSLPPDTQ